MESLIITTVYPTTILTNFLPLVLIYLVPNFIKLTVYAVWISIRKKERTKKLRGEKKEELNGGTIWCVHSWALGSKETHQNKMIKLEALNLCYSV